MKPTRIPLLIALVAVPALVTWALLGLTYVSLPPLPWTAVPTLLLLALGESYTAVNLRPRIQRRQGAEPIEPLVVARMAALAKASAHAAAALAGIFGGFAVYLSADLDKTTPRHDFFVSGGTFLSAVALVAAALFLEYVCRVPRDENEERDTHRA